MAKYLLLIYGDEQLWQAMSAEEIKNLQEGHAAFAAAAGDAILGGHELEPSITATSLRGQTSGRSRLTDGAFLETKEVLGGYYVVEATDLDAAIALAEKLPELSAAHSGVEIRPIREELTT
ncbi:YciI family protein [Nonomuraea thailandensis]